MSYLIKIGRPRHLTHSISFGNAKVQNEMYTSLLFEYMAKDANGASLIDCSIVQSKEFDPTLQEIADKNIAFTAIGAEKLNKMDNLLRLLIADRITPYSYESEMQKICN